VVYSRPLTEQGTQYKISTTKHLEEVSSMKRITLLLVGVATLAGVVVFGATTSRHVTAQEAAPIFVTNIPDGYRDWRFISVAHEAANSTIFEPFWVTTPRSRPTGQESFRSRRAQSLRA